MTSYSMIAALDKLEALRADLLAHYEATFSVDFPATLDGIWRLHLDIVPFYTRTWLGDTLQECVDWADTDVRRWMSERE